VLPCISFDRSVGLTTPLTGRSVAPHFTLLASAAAGPSKKQFNETASFQRRLQIQCDASRTGIYCNGDGWVTMLEKS